MSSRYAHLVAAVAAVSGLRASSSPRPGIRSRREAGTLRELFARRLRRPLAIGVSLAVFQQVTGINTVIYYGRSW